jgi:hypothetical protein
MDDRGNGSGKDAGRIEREKRLAAALRDNLKRRKAAERAARAPAPGEAEGAGDRPSLESAPKTG